MDSKLNEIIELMTKIGKESSKDFNYKEDLLRLGCIHTDANGNLTLDMQRSKIIGITAKRENIGFHKYWWWFIDLYALLGWTTMPPDTIKMEMKKYTLSAHSEIMFQEYSDNVLYDEVTKFCVQNIRIDGVPEIDLDEYVISGNWANDGSAADMIHKETVYAKTKSLLAITETLTVDYLVQNYSNKCRVFPKVDRKERMIITASTSQYILGKYVGDYCLKNLKAECFRITNSDQFKDVDLDEFIGKKLLSNYILFPIDQSSFDLNQRKSAVLAARDFLINYTIANTKEARLGVLLNSSEEIEYDDITINWEHGLLSGMWYTSIVGSILNAFEVQRCLQVDWCSRVSIHQGDDAIISLLSMGEAKLIYENAKRLNIPINPDKNFLTYGATEYLHNYYLVENSRYSRYRYTTRAFTSIVYGPREPSVSIKTEKEELEAEASRILVAASRTCTSVDVILKNVNHEEKLNEYLHAAGFNGGFACKPLNNISIIEKLVTKPKVLVKPTGIERSIALDMHALDKARILPNKYEIDRIIVQQIKPKPGHSVNTSLFYNLILKKEKPMAIPGELNLSQKEIMPVTLPEPKYIKLISNFSKSLVQGKVAALDTVSYQLFKKLVLECGWVVANDWLANKLSKPVRISTINDAEWYVMRKERERIHSIVIGMMFAKRGNINRKKMNVLLLEETNLAFTYASIVFSGIKIMV